MKLGVHIGYWGLGLSSQDQIEIVQEAERLGYDSVWTAEASRLALAAASGDRLVIGDRGGEVLGARRLALEQ